MGNSSSSDQNEALQVPSGPMQSLAASWIAQTPTKVRVKMSKGGTSATVTDTVTTNQMYTFKHKLFSSRTLLKASEGETLVSIKNNKFSNKFRIFPGDQPDQEQFTICDVSGMLNTTLLVTEFYDQQTGTSCRVGVKGGASQHVVLCYLERGSPELSKLNNSEDFEKNQEKYQSIGQISRGSKVFAQDEYSIEASPGVDLTLLLLFLHARHVKLVAERSVP